MTDPNPKVSGRGISELQDAGIEVTSGILEDEAGKLNEAYAKYITTGKPFVTLKVAMTLDGKIATPEGQSKWITGEQARKKVHTLRSRVDAIMTAIGTVKADDPQLTVRLKKGKNPLRVVIDPYLEVPLHARILRTPPPTMIVTRERGAKSDQLEKSGIGILHYSDRLDLGWLMETLGEMEDNIGAHRRRLVAQCPRPRRRHRRQGAVLHRAQDYRGPGFVPFSRRENLQEARRGVPAQRHKNPPGRRGLPDRRLSRIAQALSLAIQTPLIMKKLSPFLFRVYLLRNAYDLHRLTIQSLASFKSGFNRKASLYSFSAFSFITLFLVNKTKVKMGVCIIGV